MFKSIPFNKVNWITSSFLIGTLLASLTLVPWYIWQYGIDWFYVGLFIVFYIATGMSITLGYHRLFSHLSFKAKWPVKVFTLIFGAAAFENSCLDWSTDHRRHHKHCDHDDDPYDISKGLFHAHIGWLLFKLRPERPYDNVNDLLRDKMVMFQHRWVHLIALFFGILLPTGLGYAYDGGVGALGGFLIGGILRIVCVQHSTFFINSLCHYLGTQPYNSNNSARDSWIMALFTFGEGYHNYHHYFQHDYRNGVKPWQFDPTKWAIWVLSKLGMAEKLRRVAEEKILMAELNEAQKRIQNSLQTAEPSFGQKAAHNWEEAKEKLETLFASMNEISDEIQLAVKQRVDLEKQRIDELRREIRDAIAWNEHFLRLIRLQQA